MFRLYIDHKRNIVNRATEDNAEQIRKWNNALNWMEPNKKPFNSVGLNLVWPDLMYLKAIAFLMVLAFITLVKYAG